MFFQEASPTSWIPGIRAPLLASTPGSVAPPRERILKEGGELSEWHGESDQDVQHLAFCCEPESELRVL